MPEKNVSSRILVLSLILSSIFGAAFGFASGLLAANDRLMESVLAALPPAVRARAPGIVATLTPPPVEKAEPVKAASDEVSTIAAVKTASPAVVSIIISKDVPVMEQYFADPFGGNNDFFQQFFGNMMPQMQVPQYRQNGTQKKEIGAGTGFLVSADGYIVTNRHVVSDETAEYSVSLSDGRKFTGKVIGRDPSNDVAVIKIEGQDFPVIALGDSEQIEVGQKAIAIGYALGRFGNTVSTGVISGLQRSLAASDGMNSVEDLFDVIQTDAAINPGNSGGPLLNLRGEAIGMNVAIVQGSQNIGFALPINDVKKVYESLKTGGKIVRPYLGVRYVMISDEIKKVNQLSVDHGALVLRGERQIDLAVVPGSPADKAGIVENDIILEVDGKKVTVEYPLAVAIRKFSVGDKVKLKVMHQGKENEVELTLEEKK